MALACTREKPSLAISLVVAATPRYFLRLSPLIHPLFLSAQKKKKKKVQHIVCVCEQQST